MTSPITPQLINHLKPLRGLITAQRAEAYIETYSPYQLGLYVDSLEWFTQFRAPVPTHPTTTPFRVYVDQATVVIQINHNTVIIDPHAQFDIQRYTPDLIIVTHAHQDHCGGLVALCHEHPTCSVAMTAITWDLCAIHASDGITEIRERVGYTLATDGHPQIINQVELQCHVAGHLIGACMVDLRIDGVSILITGDMCVRSIAHTLSAQWPTHAYDLVLIEGTHLGESALPVADQTHNNHALVQKCIHTTDEHIVIMATALGAAQDIYTHLITAQMQGHMPRHRIYLHGKAAEVAHYYQRRFMGISPQWKLPVHELSTTTPARPSIIITSTTNEQHIASLTQRGTLIRPAFDQLLITQSTHYWHTSHASQRELICTALAIPSTHVGFYHTSVGNDTFEELAQFFAACGRSAKLMNHSHWEV